VGVVFGAALKLTGGAIEPDPIDPRIIIHSLQFTNDPEPAIRQDRTVTAKKKLTARWDAYISMSEGGQEVRVCQGGGWWDYDGGRKAPVIPIDVWTGVDGCWASLPSSRPLQACAEYKWGDGESTTSCTITFKK
jgi:hypothetical protein